MKFRAPVLDDAPAVLALLVARDVVDLGAPDYTLQDLRDDWGASDLDLTADVLVAEAAGGRIVGYAIAIQPGTMVVVAPEHEGQGIGTRLLAWVESRDRERGRQRHRQGIPAANTRARALLRAAGYRTERSYWRMARRLEDLPGDGSPPAAFRMRVLDVDRDAAPLHALNETSFAANADYRPVSFTTFCEQHLRGHDLDPGLSAVAEHGDGTVGFLLARRWEEEAVGFVDLLAVHPEYRGQGLGTALLGNAFARFAAAGLREAQLGVGSDNPGALALYGRCGMTPRFRIDAFERQVVRAPEDS